MTPAAGELAPSPAAGTIARAASGAAALLADGRFWFWLCLAFCLAADLEQAAALLPNADSVQSYNELLQFRAGNLLLRHWVLATDNYVLTDLPPFILASLVLGTGTRLIYLVPYRGFVALLAAGLLIARALAPAPDRRRAGGFAVLLRLRAPCGTSGNFFFWSDYHVATIAACLYAMLAIAPALSDQRFNRWRLLPFTVLVFAAAFSDPLADALLLGPLLLLLALRGWLAGRFTWDDGLITLCVALGAGAATLGRFGIAWAGGFKMLPDVGGRSSRTWAVSATMPRPCCAAARACSPPVPACSTHSRCAGWAWTCGWRPPPSCWHSASRSFATCRGTGGPALPSCWCSAPLASRSWN